MEIIGTPAGTNSVIDSAQINARIEAIRYLRSLSRGNKTAQKIAGEATSKPQADVSPIAFAPTAPSNVKRFQKTNTPKPVNQNAVF